VSVREPRLTEAQMAEYGRDEKDLRPWGGAGSVDLTAATIGKKNRQPNDARGKMGHKERAEFAAANQEPTQLSPEEEAQIHAAVAESLKHYDTQQYFANAVRNRIGLHEAWTEGGLEGQCPFFNGVEREGDPAGASGRQIIAAWNEFTQIPAFAAYLYAGTDRNSPRYKVQRQILDLLWEFMTINLVNMTLAGSWAACFALLQNIGVVPAPVPTTEQLQAQERSKPADDGNQVALHDDGTPITYKFKDGRVVRYSKQMLDALPSEGYAKVMNLRAVPQESEEGRRARKAKEYRIVPVLQGYTQHQLDSMPSEKYRQLLQLERNGGGKVGDRL
jgi:hypothetical protein